MKQLQGQLEVPRHSSSCGDFNLQAMMHIESSWINWIQFLPLANLGESKVKLYKMGEFCCNIVANFVKGSAAKWMFQRFEVIFTGRWSKLIQVNWNVCFCFNWSGTTCFPQKAVEFCVENVWKLRQGIAGVSDEQAADWSANKGKRCSLQLKIDP